MAKKKAAKTPRKGAAPKTRGGGTMTESAFWSMIRSALRNKSRWWKPISDCKQKSKRAYKGPNKRQKFEYQCNVCLQYYNDKNIQVDHVIPAGSLNCANDLPGFVERLFCEMDNLQTICTTCHNKKTKEDKKWKNSIV